MAIDDAELDNMLNNYRAAVEEWVAAIRLELVARWPDISDPSHRHWLEKLG